MRKLAGDIIESFLKLEVAPPGRAAEFCWHHGQCRGQFVGGTIDNPNVLDKEAAALSLDAYLLLAQATGDSVWLERARAAADFAETWIYCWNVPMPADEPGAQLPWKRGVSTVGLQLIATGHSLVDFYPACDARRYGQLYQQTGDRHYLEIARILLHNTKGMLAIPGRTYDLPGPGWQQEHWSLAPIRGFGLHRAGSPGWPPSGLDGIFGALESKPETREQLQIVSGNDQGHFYPCKFV